MYDELGLKPLIGFDLRNRIFFLGGGQYQRTFHSDILQKSSFLCVMLYFIFKSDRRHAKLNNPFTLEGGNWAQLDISNEFFRIYQKGTRISCRDTK